MIERFPSARGPELHAPLEPSERLAGCQIGGRARDQRAVVETFVPRADRVQSFRTVDVAEIGPEICSVHAIELVADLARLAPMNVIGGQRGPERAARVARRRLDPDALELGVAQHLAVGDAIERDAAGKTQVLRTGFRRRPRE